MHRGHSCRSFKRDMQLASLSSSLRFAMEHISDLPLVDPAFAQPGRIDMLIGGDIFIAVLRHGRQTSYPEHLQHSKTEFGWVLCGSTAMDLPYLLPKLTSTLLHSISQSRLETIFSIILGN